MENNEMTENEDKKGKKAVLGLAIGIPLLLILGVSSYFFIKKKMAGKNMERLAEQARLDSLANLEAAKDSTYFVIVGSYMTEGYALEHSTEDAQFTVMDEADNGFYRVMSEQLNTRSDAEMQAEIMKQNGQDSTWVLAIVKE